MSKMRQENAFVRLMKPIFEPMCLSATGAWAMTAAPEIQCWSIHDRYYLKYFILLLPYLPWNHGCPQNQEFQHQCQNKQMQLFIFVFLRLPMAKAFGHSANVAAKQTHGSCSPRRNAASFAESFDQVLGALQIPVSRAWDLWHPVAGGPTGYDSH